MATRELFGDDAGAESTADTFRVNSHYATKFEERKRREELQRLEEKYGPNRAEVMASSEESNSDEEEEDEVGELLTPDVDAQILRTIAAIRCRSDDLLRSEKNFFAEEELKPLAEAANEALVPVQKDVDSQSHPMTIKDYQRKILLSGEIPGALDDRPKAIPTHSEEQESLKRDLVETIQQEFQAKIEQGDDEDLFQVRDTTSISRAQDDGYRKWLLEMVNKDENCRAAFEDYLAAQEKEKHRVEMKDDEAFLMNYVFNRGWLDADANAQNRMTVDRDLDEDDQHVDKAEEFETMYNFRFEELDALNGKGSSYDVSVPPQNIYAIASHPRNDPESVRRKNIRRSEERKRQKERKEEEKRQRNEELKRLKNLKKKEIWDRLKRVKSLSGVVDENILKDLVNDDALDADFDPDKWDAVMQKVFDHNYYGTTESSDTKPVFDDDDEIPFVAGNDGFSAQVKDKLRKVNLQDYNFDQTEFDRPGGKDAYDPDFIMDADFLDNQLAEDQKSGKEIKMDLDAVKKINEFLESHYQLDYEDMIGDLPTRFKYRTVSSDSYGLDEKEILMAPDKQLNQFLSLKKLAPYRTSERDQIWLEGWKKSSKKRRYEFRKALREQLIGTDSAVPRSELVHRRLKAVERKDGKRKLTSSAPDLEFVSVGQELVIPRGKPIMDQSLDSKSTKKRKKSKKSNVVPMEKDRLSAYGLSS